MSLLKNLFNCDGYGCDVKQTTVVTPQADKPKLSTDQREALRELGRKGGKARAAKRKAIASNSPAAALAKSGETPAA